MKEEFRKTEKENLTEKIRELNYQEEKFRAAQKMKFKYINETKEFHISIILSKVEDIVVNKTEK